MMVPEEKHSSNLEVCIINNQVVLYAERLSNAHDYIPIIFGQPLEDGFAISRQKALLRTHCHFNSIRQPSGTLLPLANGDAVMDRGTL